MIPTIKVVADWSKAADCLWPSIVVVIVRSTTFPIGPMPLLVALVALLPRLAVARGPTLVPILFTITPSRVTPTALVRRSSLFAARDAIVNLWRFIPVAPLVDGSIRISPALFVSASFVVRPSMLLLGTSLPCFAIHAGLVVLVMPISAMAFPVSATLALHLGIRFVGRRRRRRRRRRRL
jgi:hypothetical protein